MGFPLCAVACFAVLCRACSLHALFVVEAFVFVKEAFHTFTPNYSTARLSHQ